MNIGILGAGGIASSMARTVNMMAEDGIDVKLGAVASRSLEKAQAFGEKYDIPVCYGSYEEMASDADIDLVYVATPHSRHYADCMMMLTGGRNVLCEKAFTSNAKEAKAVLAFAREKGLFCGEAIWTRFMPMRAKMDEIIKSGVIGEITSLTANLGYVIKDVPRIKQRDLCGGALLDLGVYPINFALMTFGEDIKKITSCCVMNDDGVDMIDNIIFTYNDGKVANLHANACTCTDRRGMVYGDKGRIEFMNINNCEGIRVFLNDGSDQFYPTPKQYTGYEYEVLAAKDAIEKGLSEYAGMPHENTVKVMEIMDSLRKEWGVVYPWEE